MRRNLEALSGKTYDLIVIGGGVNGAATAREAALRGMKVALIEARDFASGTSSRSSKLIHGGLRYLKQLEFGLVREARRERRWLLELAPHLARPVPFLLPIYEGDPYSALQIRLGLSVYDLLGNLGSHDRHRMYAAEEALRLIPGLQPRALQAAAVYHDSETDDARLTIEYALDAAAHGAVVANYAEVEAFSGPPGKTRGGRRVVASAEVKDVLTGRRYEVSSRFWVNATGPWVDSVRALLPGADGSKTVRLTKGTHVILPSVSGSYALFAAILPGERIFVMLPWLGHALLGTTDTDFDGRPEDVRPEREDVDYLLRALNRILHEPLEMKDVVGGFAGLRALAIQPGASPSENTREYRFHEDLWAANFITVCGGKLTTARSLAERLMGIVAGSLGLSSALLSRSSRRAALPGGQTGLLEPYVRTESAEAERIFAVPQPTAERIIRTYGSRWRDVLNLVREDPRLGEPLPGKSGLLRAEASFSIEEEMALKPEDFMLRRSGLSWLGATALREALPTIAAIFAERLGWSGEQRQSAVRSVESSSHSLNL
jgi:glycerol-3-phosphate dehydrogenase